MKQLMWAISIGSLIVTFGVLQLMPDSVPMHYDLAGNIDRWGTKYENLFLPVIILILSVFWHLLIAYYEKKAGRASDETDRDDALSNARVMRIVGVSMAAMFTIMQGVILYSAYVGAKTHGEQAPMDIGKVSCILIGILLIILGNCITKTKQNRMLGVRVSWSMYNDTTWTKSNRFGGIAMSMAGALAVITAVFAGSAMATVLLLVYVAVATTITLIYSHKVYKDELFKSTSKQKEG